VAGDFRRLHTEVHQVLLGWWSPKGMRWVGHVGHMKKCFQNFVGNLNGRDNSGKTRRRWEGNIIMDLRAVVYQQSIMKTERIRDPIPYFGNSDMFFETYLHTCLSRFIFPMSDGMKVLCEYLESPERYVTSSTIPFFVTQAGKNSFFFHFSSRFYLQDNIRFTHSD
jgi:hypothetical protein